MIHVFIVGSKGIPARYGGFETFVEKLVTGKQSDQIKYHVSCMNSDEKHFEYKDADCFNVRILPFGAIGRIIHVEAALKQIEKWVEAEKNHKEIIVYILGCRIGPLLIPHSRKLHRLGIRIFCNPDGLEWRRDKWSKPVKLFLKYCERCLVENCDLVICDSMNIEKYISNTYKNATPKTCYIAYGADVENSTCSDESFEKWTNLYSVKAGQYYLIVGRFVPENNFEVMISEFMKSNTKKDLVIITNVAKGKFYNRLLKKTHFNEDRRIKFVGTVYDQELLKKIREEAYAYIHGHEVGGTNPSLLEALASTKINMLFDVGFNKEVADDSALYWNKGDGNLSNLIGRVDLLDYKEITKLGKASTQIVEKKFGWQFICREYEKLFECNA